jgi:DNA-binding NtrC family response regulator
MNTSASTPPAVVLLVEDEPLVRLLGADVLSHAGYVVIEAENAAEAIKMLETTSNVSLLFTDVNMPGVLDGLDLAKVVHARWPAIRLLIVSGRDQPRMVELPSDGRFLQKPYDMQDMLGQVRKLLTPPPWELGTLPKAS